MANMKARKVKVYGMSDHKRKEVSFVDVYEERQMCMVAERGVYGNE